MSWISGEGRKQQFTTLDAACQGGGGGGCGARMMRAEQRRFRAIYNAEPQQEERGRSTHNNSASDEKVVVLSSSSGVGTFNRSTDRHDSYYPLTFEKHTQRAGSGRHEGRSGQLFLEMIDQMMMARQET
jgi:hypothetical protein